MNITLKQTTSDYFDAVYLATGKEIYKIVGKTPQADLLQDWHQ